MISYVTNLLNLFALTVHNILHVASFVGQVIVFIVTEMSSKLCSIIRNVVLFLQIVYEDNVSVFTDEVPNLAKEITDTLIGQWLRLQNGALTICTDLHTQFNAVINLIINSLNVVLIIIWEVLVLLKNAVILIGNTLWLVLTFIPVHIPQLLRALVQNVANIVIKTIIDTYMSLLKLTNFLTDVPLESFIGIISAIIIIRLCIHFRESIESQISLLYWSLVRKILYIYYVVYNYFIDSDVSMITRMASGHEMVARNENSGVADLDSDADALCIICQERQKCVLTLPCRHVCLCIECCMRLYGYQRTCPICRTFIYHSVTVYL